MRVNGEQIPEAAIQAAVEFMREKKVFSNNQIAGLFGKHKVFESYRAADRLLQQQRKTGNIKYINDVWRWVGTDGDLDIRSLDNEEIYPPARHTPD